MLLTSWVSRAAPRLFATADGASEHYFEMSKIDAKEALAIYRHFCTETERVVEYLGVAKKLQNLLNVPIPNLRHVCCFILVSFVQ